jgi:O-methyltransferase involved in polyketide biosynthesis
VLSAADSRLAGDYVSNASQAEAGQQRMGLIIDRWCQHGLDLDVTQLMYPGKRNDVATYLQAHGWDTVRGGIEELFVAHGMPRVAVEMVSWIVYVTATRK